MDIKSMLRLGCAKVASLIRGQPLEKIKEILDPKQGAAGGAATKDAEKKDGAKAPEAKAAPAAEAKKDAEKKA